MAGETEEQIVSNDAPATTAAHASEETTPPADNEIKADDAEDHAAAASMAAAVQDVAMEVVGAATATATATATASSTSRATRAAPPPAAGGTVAPKKKRLCRYPGCTRVIKSQGHCQRHGAKAKRCKIDGCQKQAQGTHDGMCKRHWKAIHFPEVPAKAQAQPPPPEGESVYDGVLPKSISYRPSVLSKPLRGSGEKTDPMDPPPAPDGVGVMPLVTFLRDGAKRANGWHRNAERRARGLFPVTSLSSQLEPWERQLALVEILLLSGGTPYANFKDLSHAWGREKGFHHVLANSVCERRGEVERKRRSDAGRILSAEQKEAFRQKLKRNRVAPSKTVAVVNNAFTSNQSNGTENAARGGIELIPKDEAPTTPVCVPVPVDTTNGAAGTTPIAKDEQPPAEAVTAAPTPNGVVEEARNEIEL